MENKCGHMFGIASSLSALQIERIKQQQQQKKQHTRVHVKYVKFGWKSICILIWVAFGASINSEIGIFLLIAALCGYRFNCHFEFLNKFESQSN